MLLCQAKAPVYVHDVERFRRFSIFWLQIWYLKLFILKVRFFILSSGGFF